MGLAYEDEMGVGIELGGYVVAHVGDDEVVRM